VKHPLTSSTGEQWASAKRIFSNGALDEGGRVYGGWQNKKARDRLDFTIDGQAVCEIDVRASYLLLAYKLSGGNALNLGADPYMDIPFVRDRPEWRKLAKELTATMLSDSPHKARFPQGQTTKEGKVVSFRDRYGIPKRVPASFFYDQIREAFPFIGNMEDAGVRLMFEESKIILDAMLSLVSSQSPVVVYPVHDCLICKRRDQDAVVEALRLAFLKHTGGVPYLEVEFNDRPPAVIDPVLKDTDVVTPVSQPINLKSRKHDWGIRERKADVTVIDDDDGFQTFEDL
jgi:hypothetical protein